MLFRHFLKRFVKTGALRFIDSTGKDHLFSATPAPQITIRFHSKGLEQRLLYSPMLALGEGYMDGKLTLEEGDIYEFLSFCATNHHQLNFSPVETLISYL